MPTRSGLIRGPSQLLVCASVLRFLPPAAPQYKVTKVTDSVRYHLRANKIDLSLNELGVFAGEGRLEELSIEWLVWLLYLMAMTSLATVVAFQWLAGASTRLTTAAT